MRGLPTSSSSARTSARNLFAHPYFRPVACLLALLLLMQGLRAHWGSMRGGRRPDHGEGSEERDKLVVAHFMLGNTYPFTEKDWHTTFDQAEETGLDALALNIGPEEWQHAQALSAFHVLQGRSGRFTPSATSFYSTLSRSASEQKLRLFVSMDMNVLPKWSTADGERLRSIMGELLRQEGYLRWKGRRVLSTFSGHDATFGGGGWEGWLEELNRELGEKIFFWPSFFLPPHELQSIPYIDGIFNWNAAWPLTNTSTSLHEDDPFLPSSSRHHSNSADRKAYMASISPLFFTHYGTTGQWAWNKNWIFPSDRLLYPTRWTQLLALEEERQPDIIQVISWNDHGESHAIGPVLGAQPGSEAWTDSMGHEAFREMTAYWVDQWKRKKGEKEAGDERLKVWMWYRTHPKDLLAEKDDVGRPDKADWAQDLINVVVVVPADPRRGKDLEVVVKNRGERRTKLERGKANMLVVPFVAGEVVVQVVLGEVVLLEGEGRTIDGAIERYNFNMWSESWGTGASER